MNERLTPEPTPRSPSPEATDLLETLSDWAAAGALRALDVALTRFIAEQGGETDAAVLLAIALTSERNGHGHVCLDLHSALAQPATLLGRLRDDAELSTSVREALNARLQGLHLDDWVARLAASRCISDWLGAGVDDGASPLVLAGRRQQPLLYLRRYWRDEQRIRAGIQARLTPPVEVDEAELRRQLQILFKPQEGRPVITPDWQRLACALAVRRRFCIVTGGPGTGKTATVVRLLALLQGLRAAAGEPPLLIELAAPTGKATARLNASIAEQVGQLAAGQAPAGSIPTQVRTLHRLLGSLPQSRHFRHDAANPLPADVVVVDEASMVDVEMMARLLEALRPEARLVLLGDKDQLSSVEAGAVLGDLCQQADPARYWPETADWLRRVSEQPIPGECVAAEGRALDQAIVTLHHSYRFSLEGGIGALANLVNRGAASDRPACADAADAARSTGADEAGARAATSAPARRASGQQDRLRAVMALFGQEQQPAQPDLGRIEAVRLSDPEDARFARLIQSAYCAEDSYLRVMRDQCPPAEAGRTAFDAWAWAVLQAQKGFQLLTPLRQGAWGVEGLNARILALLNAPRLGLFGAQRAGPEGASANAAANPGSDPVAGLARALSAQPPRGHHQWFAGRPVLMTRNDYGLNLMNGDMGVTLPVPVRAIDEQGADDAAQIGAKPKDAPMPWRLRVAFPTSEDKVRWVLPSRLQQVETVFALTVHKSQGSEFTHTALVLPDQPNLVLTRELFYTALTRAKRRFTLLYSDASVLGETLERRVQRFSGLQGQWRSLDAIPGVSDAGQR
ncbi:MAG: exodeoxyribonuclease V subunit alpha [Halochromatium sp.]